MQELPVSVGGSSRKDADQVELHTVALKFGPLERGRSDLSNFDGSGPPEPASLPDFAHDKRSVPSRRVPRPERPMFGGNTLDPSSSFCYSRRVVRSSLSCVR